MDVSQSLATVTVCPMAVRRRRRGSPDGVPWCVCCLLVSLHIVSTLAQTSSTDIGVQHKASNGHLMPNSSQDLHDLIKGRAGSTSGDGRISQLHSKDSQSEHTIAQETPKVGNTTTLGQKGLSSSEDTVAENTTAKTFYETKAGHANTTGAFFTTMAYKSGAQTASKTDTTQWTLKMHNENERYIPTKIPINNPTATVSQSLNKTLDIQTHEKNIKLKNATGPYVEEHYFGKIEISSRSTTFDMAVQHATPREQRGGTNDVDQGSVPNNKSNKTQKKQDSSTTPLIKINGTTPWHLNNTRSVPANDTPVALPSSASTSKSDRFTKPAMRSPLAALLHPSTSAPSVKSRLTNLVFNSKADESRSPFAAHAYLSNSLTSATSKTGPEELRKESLIKGENFDSSSFPPKELEAPLSRISKQNDVMEQGVVKDMSSGTLHARVSTELSPKVTHNSQEIKEKHGGKPTHTDHQPTLKTTLKYESRETRHKGAKHKSTARLRRSTRDSLDDEPTLPSSRRKSNKATPSETITLQPSNSDLLKPRKRHVPNQDPKLYSDLDCPDLDDDHTHHSIEWSGGASLAVYLHGDGEALTVSWEIMTENSKVSKGKPRHERDTDSGAAGHRHEGVQDADLTRSSSSDIRLDATDVKATEVLINGFVVSYRIPGEEEYDSSRLRASVRSFVLHQLHLDEDYIICVHAMAGHQRISEQCANWSKSLLKKKAVMGILAGSLFFLPCLVVIIIIIRKDRQMSTKNGSGNTDWQRTHPSLVRAFSTCEESQEALVQEARGRYDRGANASFECTHDGSTTGTSHVHELTQLGNHSKLAREQGNQSDTGHSCSHSAQMSRPINTEDRSLLRLSAPQDSMNNLLETKIISDGELTLLHEIVEDNAYSNPTLAITSNVLCINGSTPPPSPSHHIDMIGPVPDPNRESNI